MRKAYICSPYRAKDSAELDRHIDYAQALTRLALEAGVAPITPPFIHDTMLRRKQGAGEGAGNGCGACPAEILRFCHSGH